MRSAFNSVALVLLPTLPSPPLSPNQPAPALPQVAALTEELVGVKMALAQAREMELLFKRQVGAGGVGWGACHSAPGPFAFSLNLRLRFRAHVLCRVHAVLLRMCCMQPMQRA